MFQNKKNDSVFKLLREILQDFLENVRSFLARDDGRVSR